MSQSARHRQKRRSQPARPRWRVLRLTAILAFFGLAVLAVGFALAENAPVASGQPSQPAGGCTPTLIAGTQTQPEKWFSINSGSAADILSAAQCTDMFQSALHGSDLIASALQTGTLANPVLVKPYRSDVGLSQYWVIPVVDANKHPLALLTFLYNPQSRLLHEGEFDAVTGNMFYVNRVFPAVPAAMAVSAVSAQQHAAMVQGQTPDLIYFPGDLAGVETGKTSWNEGGTAVIDPIWRVPGADGQWHYVDHNGTTHLNTAIPVEPDYQAMPASTTIH